MCIASNLLVEGLSLGDLLSSTGGLSSGMSGGSAGGSSACKAGGASALTGSDRDFCFSEDWLVVARTLLSDSEKESTLSFLVRFRLWIVGSGLESLQSRCLTSFL